MERRRDEVFEIAMSRRLPRLTGQRKEACGYSSRTPFIGINCDVDRGQVL
jgi:hypothetical protein